MNVEIPCICPETPHEVDTVVLRDELDFLGAASVRNAVIVHKATRPKADTAEIMSILAAQYLRRGVESWTLVDADGKPVPVDEDTISTVLLANVTAAMTVADAADGLYQAVMLPLLLTALTPSQPSRTGSRTSRTNGSPRKRRKPSSPSSITTIPTAATVTTSVPHDGDSSLSRSSA